MKEPDDIEARVSGGRISTERIRELMHRCLAAQREERATVEISTQELGTLLDDLLNAKVALQLQEAAWHLERRRPSWLRSRAPYRR